LSSRLLSKKIEYTYRTVILPVVLFVLETWSLTLREEHRLRDFENRVRRRIFRPKRDGVVGGWRKLHNEELYNLYSLPSIVRIIKEKEVGRACSTKGEKRIAKGYWWENQNERSH
jgi:hypothetical protein